MVGQLTRVEGWGGKARGLLGTADQRLTGQLVGTSSTLSFKVTSSKCLRISPDPQPEGMRCPAPRPGWGVRVGCCPHPLCFLEPKAIGEGAYSLQMLKRREPEWWIQHLREQ